MMNILLQIILRNCVKKCIRKTRYKIYHKVEGEKAPIKSWCFFIRFNIIQIFY